MTGLLATDGYANANIKAPLNAGSTAVLVDLKTTIAGEDIANDWLKIKPAAPPTGLAYGLAELFATTACAATAWKYGAIVDCAGYSQMFGYAQVNTVNATVFWCYFNVGITTALTNKYAVYSANNIADNAIAWFDNVDTAGMRAIGRFCQINLYNPDSAEATITDAALYLLP